MGRVPAKRYFLDTSFMIDLINQEKKAIEIHGRIRGMELTGTPCLYELQKFSEGIESLSTKEVLSLEEEDASEASRIYRELRREGKLIADIDILIAGIVRRRGLVLVTRDGDFERVRGLDLQLYELGRHQK